MAHSADRGEEDLKISRLDGNEIRLGAGSVGSLVHLTAYLPACIS